jgi:hypothetical protein
MLMNQNNTIKNILIQSLTLSIAIIISLLLIILISNIIIFPIVLLSKSYPKIFTRIVEIIIYLGIISISCYFLIYRIVNLRKAGIPVTLSIKNAIVSPLRIFLFVLMIISFIVVLIALIYLILKTNYMFLYKLIHQ